MSKLYTAAEVAKQIGYDVQTVRRHIRDGKIEGTKPGGGVKTPWRVSQEALDTFLAGKGKTSPNRHEVIYDGDGNFTISVIRKDGKQGVYVAMTQDFKTDIEKTGEINWGVGKQSYHSSKELAALTEEAFVKAGAYAASLE